MVIIGLVLIVAYFIRQKEWKTQGATMTVVEDEFRSLNDDELQAAYNAALEEYARSGVIPPDSASYAEYIRKRRAAGNRVYRIVVELGRRAIYPPAPALFGPQPPLPTEL